MSASLSVQIHSFAWGIDPDTAAARAIRAQVFMDEQGVSAADEWDSQDAAAMHFLALAPVSACADAQITATIATARLLPDGQIGRVAVLRNYRQQGVGRQLLTYVLGYADTRQYPTLYLHAQIQTLGFYQQAGFREEGPLFMDAGIAHQLMRRR